jgi:hypothetical protein
MFWFFSYEKSLLVDMLFANWLMNVTYLAAVAKHAETNDRDF